MAEKRGGLAAKSGKRATVSVKKPSETAYIELPGISGFRFENPAGTSTTFRALEGKTTELTDADIGDFTADVVSYLSNHPGWGVVDEVDRAGGLLDARCETKAETVAAETASGNTAAVDADGAVTFAGTTHPSFSDDKIQRGMVLKIGTKVATIQSIDVTGDTATVKTEKPAAAIGAGVYSVLLPGFRWDFSGRVKQSGSVDVSEESPISSSLVITPTSRIAKATLITA